jgi:hypothetical protein
VNTGISQLAGSVNTLETHAARFTSSNSVAQT